MFLDEPVIEQGVEIGEPIEGVFLVAAKIVVGLDEIAPAEVFQDFGECAAVGDFCGFCYFAACQSFAFLAQRLDNL